MFPAYGRATMVARSVFKHFGDNGGLGRLSLAIRRTTVLGGACELPYAAAFRTAPVLFHKLGTNWQSLPDEQKQRERLPWAKFINAIQKRKDLEEVVRIMELLTEQNASIPHNLFCKSLNLCTSEADLEKAQTMFKLITKGPNDVPPSDHILSLYIRFYGKIGRYDLCDQFLQDIYQNPSYKASIKAKTLKEYAYYCNMRGVLEQKVDYLVDISSENLNNEEKFRKLMGWIIFLSGKGNPSLSKNLVLRCIAKGRAPSKLMVDSAMMSMKKNELKLYDKYLEEMRASLPQSPERVAAEMFILKNIHKFEEMQEVYDKAISAGVKPDIHMKYAYGLCLLKQNKGLELRQLAMALAQMSNITNNYNSHIAVFAINCLTRGRRYKEASDLFETIEQNHIGDVSVYLLYAMIRLYARMRQKSKVEEIYSRFLPQYGLDEYGISTVIRAFGYMGECERAHEVLREHSYEGVGRAVRVLMHAYMYNGKPEQALGVFSKARSYPSFKPTVMHYRTAGLALGTICNIPKECIDNLVNEARSKNLRYYAKSMDIFVKLLQRQGFLEEAETLQGLLEEDQEANKPSQ